MQDHYPPLLERELPPPPSWKKALGVGVVTVGLAIGTGELIFWPHLVTKHGLSLLWFAVLGITFQYFLNKEVARYTLATGEGFFTASSRVWKWLAPFWLVSAILLYIWPGWATAIGTSLSELVGFGNYKVWAWACLAAVLALLAVGRSAYAILEKSLFVIVPIFFALLVWISFYNLPQLEFGGFFKSILDAGRTSGQVDTHTLLSGIVFAGVGGMLNLAVSLWYRDKQLGMAKYIGRIENPITGRAEAVAATGQTFDASDPTNLERWKGWMRYVFIDQGVIFWGLGLATLLLLSLNAYAVLGPLGIVPDGPAIAVVQAHIFGERWGEIGFKLFLLMTSLMLFSVMWGILDALGRMVSDILYTNSHVGPFKKILGRFGNVPMHVMYYSAMAAAVVLSAFLVPLSQPLILLTISAVLGGATMAVYTPILLYLNNTRLAKPLRPGWITNIVLTGVSVFFIYFAAQSLLVLF